MAAEGGLTDAAKEVKRHAAEFSRVASSVAHISEDQLTAVLAASRQLSDILKQALPAFASTASGSQPGWSRQDTDRTCKALFKKRKAGAMAVDNNASMLGSSLLEGQPGAAADQFAAITTSRPVTREREVGEMIRQSKPAYARRPPR
jgi:hypothetical protein